MLTDEAALAIARRVQRVFGRSFITKVYRDGHEYERRRGHSAPSMAWFGNRVMRVVKSASGVGHWGDFEVTEEMMAALMLHEIGHFLIAPREPVQGYATLMLYNKQHSPGVIFGAFNALWDIMLNWHMAISPGVRGEFGDGFSNGLIGVYNASHPGSVPSDFASQPHMPLGGRAVVKFLALGALQARGAEWYDRAYAQLAAPEKAFVAEVLKVVTNPTMDPQSFYDINLKAMDLFLQISGGHAPTATQGIGGP